MSPEDREDLANVLRLLAILATCGLLAWWLLA